MRHVSSMVALIMIHVAMLGWLSLPASAQDHAVAPTPDRLRQAPVPGLIPDSAPRYRGGGAFAYAAPAGVFQDYVDRGLGLGGFLTIRVDERNLFGLRIAGAMLQYGSETLSSSLVSGRIQVDITTRNNIFWMGFGPELALDAGFMRPFAQAGIGFSYFFTESEIEGSSSGNPFAETTNFDDFTFAWHGGGGAQIPVTQGETPISIYFSAQHVGNGQVRYLREDSIIDNPDGSITTNPIESDANFMLYEIGVSVGWW